MRHTRAKPSSYLILCLYILLFNEKKYMDFLKNFLPELDTNVKQIEKQISKSEEEKLKRLPAF